MFQEFISQVQVLIVGVPDLEYEPFASQGEAAGLSSFQIMGRYTGVGLMVRLALGLLPASMWPFSHLPNVELLTSFHVFFRVKCSICSYGFNVSGGGVEFRIFLRHNLEPPLPWLQNIVLIFS